MINVQSGNKQFFAALAFEKRALLIMTYSEDCTKIINKQISLEYWWGAADSETKKEFNA